MRVLILGASGYLGRTVAHRLRKDHEVYGTFHAQATRYGDKNNMFQLDLGDTNSMRAILDKVRPQIIISCLGGDFKLQLHAHDEIANYIVNENFRKIIYISSANVFDAADESPHYEWDKTFAQSDFGNFKIQCERILVNKLGERCVIIRIPEIWGKDCPRISKLIEDTQNNIPVVTYPNLYVNYTTNIQIAEWIHYIIVENLTGIFHVGTKDTYDYMNFQSQLCTILDLKKPTFKGETAMQRLYQAVLPGRREIPEKWQMKVTDVLRFLGRVQKRKSPL